MKNNDVKGAILVILSAIAFGIMPSLSKLSIREGLNTPSILFYRFLIASIIIWCYILIKKIPYKTSKSHILYLLALSVIGYAGTTTTYFAAISYISSSIAAILLYLHPTLIVIYEIIVLKYEKDIRKIIALIISTIGIILIIWNNNININPFGIILGIMAPFLYSFYIIGLQEKRTKEMNTIAITGYVLLFSSFSFLIGGLVGNNLCFPVTIKSYVYILFFALFSSVFAIFAFCSGVKLIGPSRASIISTLEPVVATILGISILNEDLTVFVFIGGLLIILSVIILQKPIKIKASKRDIA